MSYISDNYETYAGQSVGNGQCVDFVKTASGAPSTKDWKEGIKVKGATIAPGTAIPKGLPKGQHATFKNGTYPNEATGNHAAIYVSQDAHGITVWDQWKNKKMVQPVHERKIRFKGGEGSPSDDGDAYSVIE